MNVHTKRSLSVFLCLFLLACSINTNAFAQENESFTTEDSRTAIEAKLNSITSNLAEATPLAEQEIISLVRAKRKMLLTQTISHQGRRTHGFLCMIWKETTLLILFLL